MEGAKVVKQVAEELNVDVNQLALAWVLSKGDNVCAIPGTTKVSNLQSNIAALSIFEKITQAQWDRINSLTF